MPSGTVGDILHRAWLRRFGLERPEWLGAELQPLQVRTWILRRVASFPDASLPDLAEHDAPPAGLRSARDSPVRGMASLPDQQLDGAMQKWLQTDECWAITGRLGELAAGWARAAQAHFASLDPRPPVTDKRISEKACGVVARHYAAGPALPGPGYLQRELERYQNAERLRAERIRGMPGRAEFEERFADEYEQLWCAERATALAEFSPAGLGLGWLDHPPMSVQPGGWGSGGWRAGTDLAVGLRYARLLRIDPSSTSDDGELDGEHHVLRSPTVEPDALCREVLRRACSPLGLRRHSHQAIVRAFVEGVRAADLQSAHDRDRGHAGEPPGGRFGSLKTWAAAPDARPDSTLVHAVARHAAYWAAHDTRARELIRGLSGRAAFWVHQIEWGTSRKLWSGVHSHEVTWPTPLPTADVARLIRGAFRRHLAELVGRPLTPPDSRPPGTPPPSPDDPRLLTTLSRLAAADRAAAVRLSRWIATGDDRWRTLYEELVSDGAGEGTVLRPEEFREWAQRYTGGETGEDG